MFLLFSAISASLDSLIIGINFKLNNTRIKKTQFFWIFILTFLTLFILHSVLFLFSISFTYQWLTPIIYIFFGILALFHKETSLKTQIYLTKKEICLLILSHTSDGFILSLTFLTQYTYPILCFIFAFTGTLFTLLGYNVAKKFKNSKLLTALLFFLLAIWSFLS